MTRPRTPADAGFTMLEVMVTIGISTVLMTMAVVGFRGWSNSLDHEGTANRIQAVLRDAQQRSVTEGSLICVRFSTTDDSWTVLRGRCADATTQISKDTVEAGGVEIATPSFTSSAGDPEAGVTFFPRGTATPGSVKVTRNGTSKVWTVKVEGLTGRVSIS